MGLFKTPVAPEAVGRTEDDLVKEIRALRVELKKSGEQRDDALALAAANDVLADLKREIENSKITLDRQKETHEREQRELKHMVGLEKKRQEFEVANAKREAIVAVREENLGAEQKRFEEQVKFNTDRFQSEVGYLKELMGEVLTRLPTVTVDKQVGNPRPTKVE